MKITEVEEAKAFEKSSTRKIASVPLHSLFEKVDGNPICHMVGLRVCCRVPSMQPQGVTHQKVAYPALFDTANNPSLSSDQLIFDFYS